MNSSTLICLLYNGGRFITLRVIIEPDKTTVVDLDGETISPVRAAVREKIRLPTVK
jgi:hypothetical protein